jgi:nucleoside-diphosphate-sugar epimerase
MKSKLLITGASGFIGYHLILAALEKGFEVHAAVRSGSNIKHLEGLDITLAYLDYRSEYALQKKIKEKGWDYIIHAAGITKASSQDEYDDVNAGYAYNLASAAEKAGVKKMVFVSSLAALGPQEKYTEELITETKKPQPVTAYGRSKLLAEERLKALKDLPLTILRPTAVYGPRERDLFIMMKTINGGLEPYIGKAPQHLSFLHVTDFANIAVNALLLQTTGDYNLSDGTIYDRYQLAAITKKILNRRTWKMHIPVPLVRIIASTLEKISSKKVPALNRDKLAELMAPGWQLSIEKAANELGFRPKYNLELGLRNTIEWYQANKWL